MSLQQNIQVGSGAMFPIQLETKKNESGFVELVPKVDSNGITLYDSEGNIELVPKVGWYVKTGDIELIKQNITSILTFQVGQRFRQENFGVMTWDLIEEPNTSALEFMLKEYILTGLTNGEPRIYNIQVDSIKKGSSIYLKVSFSVKGTTLSSNSYYEYQI